MRYAIAAEQPQRRPAPPILPPEHGPRDNATETVGRHFDILRLIFGYLVDAAPISYDSPWELPGSGLTWLWQAARTCRGWRNFIFGTASLWTVIDVGRSCAPLMEALKHSANLNVDIRFHDPAPIPFAIQLLFENARRIRSLVVVELDQHTIPALTPLLSRTFMPELEELWINTEEKNIDEDLAFSLQPNLVPNLQALHLTERCFDWSSPIIQRLRVLYLGRAWGEPEVPRIGDFLHALASCHNLEFLKIDGWFPNPGDETYPLAVPLPQLKRICFSGLEALEIMLIVSHIRFGADVDLEVRHQLDYPEIGGSHRVGVESVIPNTPEYIPILRTATRAVLDDLNFECWGPEGRGHLAVKFEEIEGAETDGWDYGMDDHATECGSLLTQAPLADLTIRQYDVLGMPTCELGVLLRCLPDLVSLEYDGLSCPDADLPAVLNPFTSGDVVPEPGLNPQWRSSGDAGAMVPQLRRLDITFEETWPDGFLTSLRDCLRARASIGLVLEELYIDVRDSESLMLSDQAEEELQSTFGELKELVRGTVNILSFE